MALNLSQPLIVGDLIQGIRREEQSVIKFKLNWRRAITSTGEEY
jgi:hypothetical protein